ncbi:MAG: UDP-glucose 4-epimerase GalE [Bacillota bacterium]
MKILVTGGAGFIGSHTAVKLIESGHDVFIVDNLSNSSEKVIGRIEQITGVAPAFAKVDIRDREGLTAVCEQASADDGAFDACIHFAGLKAVGESVEKPWEYYENNVGGTLTLLDVLRKNGCGNIIFSSSATVYGEDNPIPYVETMPRGKCSSTYGWTKSMIEQILENMTEAGELRTAVLLRYFNPVGAHPSGLIGEDPRGIPNNLMPYISQVAVGRLDSLTVFGNDYDTPDGTCRRDYLHVQDLAEGHVRAVEKSVELTGTEIYNLGTGRPVSVLEMIKAFAEVAGVNVPYKFGPRRDGDLPQFWADPSKAEEAFGWKACFGIEDMCRDAWNWQNRNPEGY